jgi:hypothetical protein
MSDSDPNPQRREYEPELPAHAPPREHVREMQTHLQEMEEYLRRMGERLRRLDEQLSHLEQFSKMMVPWLRRAGC